MNDMPKNLGKEEEVEVIKTCGLCGNNIPKGGGVDGHEDFCSKSCVREYALRMRTSNT